MVARRSRSNGGKDDRLSVYDIARGTTGGFSKSRGSKDPIFTRHVLPIHSIPIIRPFYSAHEAIPLGISSAFPQQQQQQQQQNARNPLESTSRYIETKSEDRNKDPREEVLQRADGREKKKHRWNSSRGSCIGIENIVVSETRWNRGQPEANASNYSRGDRFPASRMIVTASSPFLQPVYSDEITREPAFPLAAIL